MGMKNQHVKITLGLFFFILSITIYWALEKRKESSNHQHLALITDRYQHAYNTIYDQYEQLADNIRFFLIENYDIPRLYQKLQHTDEIEKSRIRETILEKHLPLYTYMKKEVRVKQLQFHLSNNESFLRLHRPDRYGDNLTGIRETVEYVNMHHKAIGGFEEGRLYGGYRFVYPVTTADGSHLGSMEIAFGPDAFTASLMEQYNVLSNFFIKEEISKRKVFAGELDSVYKDSHHQGFLFDSNVLNLLKDKTMLKMEILRPSQDIRDKILRNVALNEPHSIYDPTIDRVFTTIPVFNPISGNLNSFLTVRSDTPFFAQNNRHYRTFFFLSLFLTALTLCIFYLQYSRRAILAETNNNLEKEVNQRTRELQKSQEEWEKTFDAIPDLITIQDKDMRIIRANQATFDFFQIPQNDLIGTTCHQLFRCEERPCNDCPGILSFTDSKKHSGNIDHEFLGRIFRVSSSPILNQNNEIQYTVNIARDITESLKIEKELQQAQKMEAIGTLAGGIAHDFNNILGAIIGYAEILKPSLSKNSTETNCINGVLEAGKRAAELVKQILTFSRSRSQENIPLRVDIVIKEAVKMLRASLPSSIEIRMDIDKVKHTMVLADPTNIHQVVVNLCTNAAHAIGAAKGTLEIGLSRREIGPEHLTGKPGIKAGSFLVLAIKDNGQGMSSDTMERIFEPYFTTKGQGKGSGLGLAITHGIIEKCKGFITVDSTVGEGTAFHVFLPYLEETTELSQPTVPTQTLPTGSEHILIIDDEQHLLEIEELILTRLGYRVTATKKSSDALKIFKNKTASFDLVITDQTMPGLTGNKLAQKLLDIRPDIPIILCTGYSSTLSVKEIYDIGIQKIMKKPLIEHDLAHTVRIVLNQQKPST